MKLYGSVISKHLICPPPDRPNKLDCSYPIVGNKDLLNHTLATIATNKFTWSCNLEEEEKEQKGGGVGRRRMRRKKRKDAEEEKRERRMEEKEDREGRWRGEEREGR